MVDDINVRVSRPVHSHEPSSIHSKFENELQSPRTLIRNGPDTDDVRVNWIGGPNHSLISDLSWRNRRSKALKKKPGVSWGRVAPNSNFEDRRPEVYIVGKHKACEERTKVEG